MNAKTLRRVLRPSAGLILAAVVAFVFAGRGSIGPFVQAQSNPIVAENTAAGTLDNWDISGAGDTTIQGFATDISVNKGDTVSFKVKTDSSNYLIDIYRLGYYGGAGARKYATVSPSVGLPQAQPACISDSVTGLTDCGNWSVSASWSTTNAVSGIYVARLKRVDNGGASHMVFIVRDDARQADVVVQTSDTTWQAYNQYGGGSLYCGGPKTNPPPYSCAGRATKVSYNRPIDTRQHDATSFLFNAEYPMVRFLEANGYDVKYISGVDTERNAANLIGTTTKPKAFFSVGHDEYWSAGQRASVEAARNAGVNLAFFSGNEMYWKTRFESSIAGALTPYRTLVGYKDTLGGVKLDTMPGVSTGTWRDARFAPPVADGGRPENNVSGTIWTVNSGTSAITVPASMAKLRFWKNTRVENLTSGAVTLAPDTLGYEWDEDLDNGARPDGLIHLSATTVNGVEKILDFGETVGVGTATHNLTLYRHSSGALVFGAGTVQWSWGLDSNHDRGANPPDQAMQQATVNLLAEMGAQPSSLQIGADPAKALIAASKSLDVVAPSSGVTAPASGGSVGSGDRVTITGTAADNNGGGIVAGVEVSVDGGASWHLAQGTTSWTYEWMPGAPGSATIRTRAIDDSGNREIAGAGSPVTITAGSCPCTTLFNAAAVPATLEASDETPVELGLKFRSDVNGFVKGVRFYKGAGNTGTHVGNLWTIGGALLASATFTAESASGWQEMLFNGPIPVTANTTYVVSYHTNVGRYSASGGYLSTVGVDRSPLHAPVTGTVGGNGVYAYGVSAFPTQTYNATNYFVDVVFDSTPDTAAPMISDVLATAIDSSVAVITWNTDEAANSRVDYSTSSAFPALGTSTVSDPAFVTAHSVRVTGLSPSTAYYFRVRSADRSGNTASVPSGGVLPGQGGLPPTFTMPNPTLHDTTSADFAAGSSSGTYAAETFDGELTLAPAKGTEFSGTTIPAGWAAQIYNTGGFARVAGGKLTVDGARVAACVVDAGGVCHEDVYLTPSTSLEFVATFTGDPYQHSGFAKTLASSEPIALFSTTWTDATGGEHSGSSLGVRSYNGTDAAETRTNLGTGFLNAPHRFRIDWQSDKIVYSVDGAIVATHAVAIPGQMRPVAASDYIAMSGDIVVDWVRTTPYAASGTFLSRVFDGSPTGVNWNNISWVADVPAGTTLALSVRTGSTATPDATWTPFAPAIVPGAISLQSRYIQYRADLATSDVRITPVLSDVLISGVALPPAPPPPSDQTITFLPLGAKTFGNPAFAVSATSTSGLPVTFAIASGPATIAGNMVTITGAGTVTVRASAAGGSISGATYRPAADVDQSFAVAQATQTISFGALANKPQGSAPFAVSATASSGLAVAFSIVSGPATIPVGSNVVTLSGAGVVKVRASQLGNANYTAATAVEQSFTVTPVMTASSAVVASNNTPSLYGVQITLTATVSPTAASGAVTFMDGTTALVCAAGSSLAAPVATCKTSALAIGTHAITAVFAGSASLYGSTSPAFSQVITPSAKLQIKYNVFALQDNTAKPKVAVIPAPNAIVKVFSTATSCVGNIFAAINPKKWGVIFDGADGPGGVDGCAPVSYGSYQATGTTDANGLVTIIVPPLALSWNTQYLVIGRATNFDYVKTAVSPDPLYSMYPVLAVPAGTTRSITLALVATFNGKIVPGKSIEEYGTYLSIIQPEYMDWTNPVELYPFVLVAEGDWGVETSVTPPDGFVASEPVLSTQVVDNVTALQFTLSDIGSDWTETGITHVITHKGETRIRTSAVPMFNKQPNAANGENAGKTDTHTATGEVKRPLLPSRLIATLVGLLY